MELFMQYWVRQDNWILGYLKVSKDFLFIFMIWFALSLAQALHGALSWEEQEVELPDLPD